jgi:hypothetical protein
MSELKPNPHPKTWKSICLIREARINAKQRAEDLVRTRKVLEQDLDRLGAGNSQVHLQKSRDLVLCLREIQYQRDQMRQLSDQSDEAIGSGMKGEIVEIDPKTLSVRVDEAVLFHSDRDDEDDDDETPPLPGIEASKRMDAEEGTFKIPIPKPDTTPVGTGPVAAAKRDQAEDGGPLAKVGKKAKAKA